MKRFEFIDDLRGLAALAVAVSHLVWLLPHPLPVLEIGRLGVEVFFVISGFVIAYSLRGASISPRFVGNFFVKRSLRLDPVYWVVIVVELVILVVVWSEPLPAPTDILINALYLQDLLGRPAIVSIAWTLAMELQFYLFFVVVLGVTSWLDVRSALWARFRLSPVVFTSLAMLSVVTLLVPDANSVTTALTHNSGLFFRFWFMFFGGVVVCWVYLNRVPSYVIWAYAAFVWVVYFGFSSTELFPEFDLSAVFTTVVMVVVSLVSTTGVMTAGLGSKVIRYLGRISYSLYLTHWVIGVSFIYWVAERYGEGPELMLLTAAAALALSILSAHLLYVLVEEPAIGASRRYGRRMESGDRDRSQTASAGQSSPTRGTSTL